MQFKTVRHRDQDGNYHEGKTVQCLRRVREVTPDFPEGKNVQRVVAKFDRAARELPAEVAAVLTPAEQDEWKGFCRSKGLRLKSACVARLFKRPVSRTGWQRTRLCLVGSTALF